MLFNQGTAVVPQLSQNMSLFFTNYFSSYWLLQYYIYTSRTKKANGSQNHYSQNAKTITKT